MERIYIGVDPGKSGAFAVLLPGKEPIVKPWDDATFVHDIEFDSYEPIMGDSKAMISYRIQATPKALERIPEDFAKKAGIATVAPENVHKMIFDAMNSIGKTEAR